MVVTAVGLPVAARCLACDACSYRSTGYSSRQSDSRHVLDLQHPCALACTGCFERHLPCFVSQTWAGIVQRLSQLSCIVPLQYRCTHVAVPAHCHQVSVPIISGLNIRCQACIKNSLEQHIYQQRCCLQGLDLHCKTLVHIVTYILRTW